MTKNQVDNVAEILAAARSIADLAFAHGFNATKSEERPQTDHLGAILADAILQAGLNYSTVVRPRVDRIIREYPEASVLPEILAIVGAGSVPMFLNWAHTVKSTRFIDLVNCLNENNISNAQCLKIRLSDSVFRDRLRSINGIGPKTIDYMSCLVGIDCIAVDRHVRSFARRAGVARGEYEYLKKVFGYAADMMSVPRRDFDAWIWRTYAESSRRQLHFCFESNHIQ